MFITVVANGFPSSRYKGNGIFEFDQAKAIARKGHKVALAVLDLRSFRRIRKWGITKKFVDGVHVYIYSIPLGKINSRTMERVFNSVSANALSKLYQMIVSDLGKPDIIHGHFTEVGHATLTLKRKTGIPLVFTEHSSLINKDNIDPSLFDLAENVYNNADTLIAVSPALGNAMKRNFGVSYDYVPNIVDTNVFSYKQNVKDSDEFVFVSTGNLVKNKRMDLTIDAFSKAFRDNPLVKLKIFGDGPEKQELLKQIAEYHLEERVILMGMQERQIIAETMQESDVFVLASRSETFGVSYIEAMACGLPVVATKCGGPETFVENSNGILVEVDDMNELTEALLEIYSNSNRYNSIEISEDIRMKFSPEIVAEKLINIYKKYAQ